MKKLLTFILALALLLTPGVINAGALTISSANRISIGNFASVTGVVTATTGGTIATGLSSIIYFNLSAESADTLPTIATSAYSYAVSGGTVTVFPVTGGIRWRFFAIGGP